MQLNLPDPLLLDLYACTAEPARWPAALDRLCAETGACSAVVQAFSLDGSQASIHWSAQDSRTPQRPAPLSNGVSDDGNPRLAPTRALRGLNRIAGDNDLFDAGDEARPRLQQQLAALGLGRFIGTLQDVGGGTYLGLALHRAATDRGDFSASQLERLAGLAPHIGQAFVLTRQQQLQRSIDERLRQHADQLRCAMLVCSAQGAVQWFNRSASILLGPKSPLSLDGQRLRARRTDQGEALQRTMALAAADRRRGVHYLALGQGAAVLHVAAQATAGPLGLTSVLLVITPADAGGDIPTAALSSLFGLTPAEARLLGAMVTGSSVEAYAQHRGISVGTVRGQLKQVQAKTGARRQAELVRLVLSSAAAQLLPPADDISGGN